MSPRVLILPPCETNHLTSVPLSRQEHHFSQEAVNRGLIVQFFSRESALVVANRSDVHARSHEHIANEWNVKFA